MAPARVSVVVPAYNSAATIDLCLDALADQTLPQDRYETLVIDDGSSDDTAARVRAHAGVRLVTQDHAGPAAARNLGARRAEGDLLLFTDADCAPTPGWIEAMAAPLEAGTAVGVKGAYLSRQRELVARFVQLEYEDKYDRMAGEPAIDFIDTYAAGYRRDLFLANGGFDTSFPVPSVEDQEFSFRLAEQGHRLAFVPQARVYHLGHARTPGEYCRKKLRIGYWKVLVGRRHPAKLVRDSHTPQVLKVQMGLVALAGLGLVAAIAWPPLAWAAAGLGLLFLLTTVPFCVKAWRRDRPVALLSPPLLLLRAASLGAGLAAGLLAHARPQGRAAQGGS